MTENSVSTGLVEKFFGKGKHFHKVYSYGYDLSLSSCVKHDCDNSTASFLRCNSLNLPCEKSIVRFALLGLELGFGEQYQPERW